MAVGSSRSRRFPIRYSPRLRWLFSIMGLGPRFSGVDLTPTDLVVTMGWAFASRIPRERIRGVARDKDKFGGIGVHGFARTYLVNGTTTGIVRVDVDPAARAYLLAFPVRLKRLYVSLEDPDGFVSVMQGDGDRRP